jgi:anthranilate phosphoribosyltransferase
VAKNLGAERIYVVHGSDGLDEITTSGPSYVAELNNGAVRTFELNPEELGLKKAKPESLRGGDAEANASALRSVLQGKDGAYRDIAVLNAAAALVVAGRAENLKDGVAVAKKSIDSGDAESRLDRLVSISNS